MIKYILKRISYAFPVLIGISLISFSLLYVFPGDPAELIVSITSGTEPSKEMIEKFRKESGLDKPIYIQYINWLSHAIRGDFGKSWKSGEPVMDEIIKRLKPSLELFSLTFIISLEFAFILGTLSAIYKDKFIDNISRLFTLLGISIPSFWLGLILIWIFSVKLRILPAFGYGSIKHLILPVITWSFSFMAIKTRFIRSSILEVLNEDYILTARAKGLPERVILLKHALRNALIPIITYLGLSFHHLIIGSVIVESVFSWPGLGRYLVESVISRDFPVVQALVFLSGILMITVNLIIDILYAIIDPRIRYEG
ncbi:ABC transporter permease [Methanocaldococcus villosus KIN24-T80]|uniref:ABC transporter permease n=1 Tax=Methanocaldococcus villosus KIN24-T80 TaxID=1069083 RepID=N6VR30_9EURY|nr:nickel ABC transporter permease [Methanocaldococcus villosus]ENN96365.1 ABC transporter permease [Methanocaldococcus villosus KIN24-T80]